VAFWFDFSSNAWAPLQEIIVTGLENTKESEGTELAVDLVQGSILQNYISAENVWDNFLS
jgi:hypothetical protein